MLAGRLRSIPASQLTWRDGGTDVVGFGDGGVYASFNDRKANFVPVQKLISEFAHNGGERSLELDGFGAFDPYYRKV